MILRTRRKEKKPDTTLNAAQKLRKKNRQAVLTSTLQNIRYAWAQKQSSTPATSLSSEFNDQCLRYSPQKISRPQTKQPNPFQFQNAQPEYRQNNPIHTCNNNNNVLGQNYYNQGDPNNFYPYAYANQHINYQDKTQALDCWAYDTQQKTANNRVLIQKYPINPLDLYGFIKAPSTQNKSAAQEYYQPMQPNVFKIKQNAYVVDNMPTVLNAPAADPVCEDKYLGRVMGYLRQKRPCNINQQTWKIDEPTHKKQRTERLRDCRSPKNECLDGKPNQSLIFRHQGYAVYNKLLGRGSFCTVYEGILESSGQRVAVKQIRECIDNELFVMNKVTSEYILKMLGHWVYRQKTYIALELCEGSLWDSLKQLTLPGALGYFAQILKGVKCLHEHSIIHRDIKLQNILKHRSGKIKISDFGFAKFMGNRLAVESVRCGTPSTMAPEIFFDDSTKQYGANPKYNSKCDVWSLGIVLHELVYKTHPFNYDPQRFRKRSRIRMKDSIPAIEEVLAKTLVFEPAKRCGLVQLISSFEVALARLKQPLPKIQEIQEPAAKKVLDEIQVVLKQDKTIRAPVIMERKQPIQKKKQKSKTPAKKTSQSKLFKQSPKIQRTIVKDNIQQAKVLENHQKIEPKNAQPLETHKAPHNGKKQLETLLGILLLVLTFAFYTTNMSVRWH